MSDQIVSGDSKEAVAYALLVGIAHKQGKAHMAAGYALVSAEEDWVLSTYKKCLDAIEKP